MNEFDVDYQGFTLVTESPTLKPKMHFVESPVESVSEVPTVVEPVETRGHSVEEFPFHLCDETLLTELSQIPDRLAFKIGDVAEMAQIKTYVLRYWETEFDVLHPKKSKNNQRMYSKRDVENVFLIKKLLYRDRFSIEGARAALKQLKTQVKKERKVIANQSRYREGVDRLQDLLADIQALKSVLAPR